MQLQNKSRKLAARGMLIALAFVLAWIESQFVFVSIAPGMKLGLTNLVVLIALYKINEKEAVVINVLRILLVGMTFGNMFSFIYSLAGGLLSATVMIVMKKVNRFSKVTVSVAGGIMHNVGQIVVAMIVMKTTAVLYYVFVLWISGIVAGALVGMLSAGILKHLEKVEF